MRSYEIKFVSSPKDTSVWQDAGKYQQLQQRKIIKDSKQYLLRQEPVSNMGAMRFETLRKYWK